MFNIYLFLIYLFGCVGSWLWHTGSFLGDAQVSLVVGRVGSVVGVSQLSCPNACGVPVPQPGTEFMFFALEGGFLTTGPPGKSLNLFFYWNIVELPCCVNYCCIAKWLSYIYIYIYSFAGKDWGQGEKGATEYEMVGWHHWLNGYEFEQTPGDSEGPGSLACCSPWGHKELETTEQQFFFIFFSIMVYHRILKIVDCAI